LATLVAAKPCGPRVEVAILLSDDERIRALNCAFRGLDRATDVLSFPSGESGFLGDIAVAHGAAAADAARDGKPISAHLSHLIVHAMLHLLGHDHATDDEAARMEAIEVRVLADLGIPDPYAAARDE
jgi:probable rRNA maturation factor